jgi:glutamyl-tRNA synthetase
MKSEVRTRFAVSPTGYMHVGGVRNALFDWLVARQAGGKFIVRIEDTDQAREVEGATQHIIDSLHQLGIDWDEGPDIGGPSESYIQSERLDIYKQWAQKLVDAGKAYADPYSAEEVQAFREAAQKAKQPFLYRNHRPEEPPIWDGTQPLRLKSTPKSYTWQDEVMGELSAGEGAVDDFILMKSDGFPTYNFCHIIDDHLMNITHVIRSQEFLASVPKYLNLYEALEIPVPIFGTLPWIMAPAGNKKLSKRDGAKDVLTYIQEGYLPEALLSFIATLGWNDGTEQEVFTKEELIAKFSLNRVGRSGAQFDEKRLNWVNGHFIRELSLEDLYQKALPFLPKSSESYDDAYKKAVIGLIQERLKFLAEIPELTSFFFEEPKIDLSLIDTNKQLKKVEKSELKDLLQSTLKSVEQSDFSAADIQTRLNSLLEETGQKPAVLFSIIRIATTWAPASPQLSDTLAVLGKELSLRRLQNASEIL